VNVSHLVRLPQQFAQRGHFPIDGRIAVVAVAQRSDQAVQHLLVEGAESFSRENLVDLTEKGAHVLAMPARLPEEIGITARQLPDREFLDGLSQIFERGQGETAHTRAAG
jgi:hypothetical protein